MKKIVGLWAYLLLIIPAFSQVDTSYIYNTAMPYGTLDLRLAKSATRYYYLQEDVTFSFRESAPGVKTNTYHDMTSWNSEPYRQGNLREKNGTQDYFVMNYRLLFPKNYNAAYDPGYPIIIMLHGYGERGNCWNDNCYWSTTGWNPNINSPAAPTSPTHNLLNNDHNLLHGGLKHLDAVNLAGSRLPNDPSMPDKAFPGFVLFPQVLNGWQTTARVEDAIKLLRLVIKKYNIDENRVYIHALSNGGGGLYQAIKRAPWLFAAALPMSAVSNGGIFNDGMAQEVGKIPMWVFQGAKDTNPTPSRTYNTVKGLREAGASVRYYLYPHLGHGTWNTAYNEPDFFPWILQKRKYNPHVYYGNPVICNTNGVGVRMSFSNGFFAYQWQVDGTVIPGATSSQYIANTPGTYRGRFSRVPNPGESDWEPWSDEIVVTEISPAKPTVTALGSTHLRGPGLTSSTANNTVQLRSDQNAEQYLWFKNGVQIDFPGTDVNDTLRLAGFTSAGAGANGAYTLKTSFAYCPSPASDPVYLFFNNSAPQNMIFTAAAADFKGVPMNNGVFLTWNDLVSSESGYEIWRRKSGSSEFKFAGRAAKNSISFFDGPLEPNATYEYKIRAVGNTGVSNYVPSNDLAVNLLVSTPPDTQKPLPPQDLKVTLNTINSFTISWKAPQDNTGIKSYIISYGGVTINTSDATTSYTISNLPANTVYPVVVRAVDHAGNISEASNQIIGSTYVLGLFYKHSTGGWEDLDDTTLVETWNNPEFTGTVSNVTLAPRTQEDFFNFMFTGYVDILTEGPYVFRLTSNDGSRLLIDDALVIENDGLHGNVTKLSDTLTLSKGPHRLELQYFDYAGSQILTLQYKGPDLTTPYKNIPDSLYRSGKYIAPAAPSVPVNVTASATGLERIDVSWTSTGENVEIYRSESADGSFVIVGSNTTGSFADTVGLKPGTAYFYKLRTVTSLAMSGYSSVVTTTTQVDNIAPAVPTGLALASKSHTNAALTWTQSTDNAAVVRYEIYSNGILMGTSTPPAFMVTNLEPGSNYTITVVAVDASNNKSAASVGLALTTNPAATYYSLPTGNLNALSTWKQFANGTGNSPVDFAENGLVFIISNRTATGMGGAWEVSGGASRIIVPSGVTLTVDYPLVGKLDLEGNATVNVNTEVIPTFGKISATSTVNFIASSTIPSATYGNLIISGSGIKSFEPGTTSIAGDLTVAATATLKGASGNESQVVIGGNITQQSTTPLIASDNRVDFRFIENKDHAITTSSNVYAYRIATGVNSTVSVNASPNPVKIIVGSFNGGGLSLQSSSTLNVNTNSLQLIGAGTINASAETGILMITGGDLKILSSSQSSSNLFFDVSNNTVDSLVVDLAGGQVVIGSIVNVQTALVINQGNFAGNGMVTLKASAEHTASLSEIGAEGVYSGNIKVQHFIPYAQDQRIELSSPVAGVTVANWQTYFPVTGSFAGASAGSTDPSLFFFNGSLMSPYPPAGGSNSAPIEKAKGYQAKILNSNAFILEQVGNPYQGSTPIALTGNPTGGFMEGWNLIGNPYASAIVWSDSTNAFTKTGVANTIAIKENRIIDGVLVGQYQYYSSDLGAGTVPSGAAFWIKTYDGSASLVVHEKAKGAPQGFNVKNDVSHLKVTMKQNMKEDHLYILFGDQFSDGLDPRYDFPKKPNEGIFNISSSINGTPAAINALSKSFCSTSVPLIISGAPIGSYSLEFSGLSSLTDIGQVALVDSYTNTSTVITGSYSFQITADPASSAIGRFTIRFTRSEVDIATPTAVAMPVCSEAPAIITISNSQPGVAYAAMTPADVVISPEVEGTGETITLEVPVVQLQPGDNPLKIRAGFPGCAAVALQSSVSINNTQGIEISTQEDASVCIGSTAMLSVSGVPSGGSYRWYDQEGVLVAGQSGSTFQTQPVEGELVYQVSGVLNNGCETSRKTIHVYADTLKAPEITLYRDTLFAQVNASFQWHRNGNVIAGATQTYLVPNQTGSYTVVATSSGCSKESLPFNYVIDPACDLDTSLSDVTLENDECGPEEFILAISNTNADAIYSVINVNDEVVSSALQGSSGNLTLTVASSGLDSGMNHLRIRVEKEGCVNRSLDKELDINNMAPIVLNSPDTITTCLNTTATLAVADVAGVASYQWFDETNTSIQDATQSSLTTQPIGQRTTFYVSAVHSSGCASPREKIVVEPVVIAKPVITVLDGVMTIAANEGIQWYLEGEAIEGANAPTLRPAKSGSYTVKISIGNCSEESLPYLFLVTSIGEGSNEFRLDAYPVPSASKSFGIRVQSPDTNSILIRVIDMTGRVVFEKWYEPVELSSKLPLTGLANGVYRVMASQGELELGKKIVIRN